ncbi:hypothetical protein OSB04_un001752 [Centaurea solstitialis]|uniref:Uncharacterized protein n=1 Tax=Centaurea solstitialis TaxID=347529 RepID=A0AA38S2S8_9ASTR|nr:hypothetical protein OSB04_un001752 [Centaurea solstitialis]
MGFEEIFGDIFLKRLLVGSLCSTGLRPMPRLQHDVKLNPKTLDFAAVVGKGSSDKLSFFPLENLKLHRWFVIPVELPKEVYKKPITLLLWRCANVCFLYGILLKVCLNPNHTNLSTMGEGISRKFQVLLGVPKQMDACQNLTMCDKAWGRARFCKGFD